MQIPIPIIHDAFLEQQGAWMAESEQSEPELILMLRESIWNCGLSLNELAAECGIAQSQLSRFMNNKRTLSLPTAARLFEHLGFKFVPPKASKQQRKQPEK